MSRKIELGRYDAEVEFEKGRLLIVESSDEYKAGFKAGYEMATEEYKVVNKTDNRLYLVRETYAGRSMGEKIGGGQVILLTEDEFEEAKLMVVVDAGTS